MTDVNLKIAEYICLAQQASDAGKGRFIVFRNKDNKINDDEDYSRSGRRQGNRKIKKHKANYAQRKGYSVKEEFILKAINLIRNNRSDFNYYVETAPDQNNYPSIISYFDFKINGKRYQVSFHTPKNLGKKLERYVGSGRKTRWDRAIGGSVLACQELIKQYDL